MRRPRTDDELDSQLWKLTRTGHTAAAEYLQELIDTESLPSDTSRAGALVQLAWHLAMEGDQAAAGAVLRRAVADDSRSHPDARCYLAEWCLDHGDPAEGERLLAQIWAERPSERDVYLFVGEVLEERDDLAGAIRWFTAGAMRSMRSADERPAYTQSLLMARRRVRLGQGFTEDEYDELALELRDELYGPDTDVGSDP